MGLELESALRDAALQKDVLAPSLGAGPLLRKLGDEVVLPDSAAHLAELLKSLNAAAHSAGVSPEVSEAAPKAGEKLLKNQRALLGSAG